jgi:hypothetical protein
MGSCTCLPFCVNIVQNSINKFKKMDLIIYIIIGAAALVIGIVAGKIIFSVNTKKDVEEAQRQAENIVKEAEVRAETIKKEKTLGCQMRWQRLQLLQGMPSSTLQQTQAQTPRLSRIRMLLELQGLKKKTHTRM